MAFLKSFSFKVARMSNILLYRIKINNSRLHRHAKYFLIMYCMFKSFEETYIFATLDLKFKQFIHK